MARNVPLNTPLLALRNIGLSPSDLMHAINRRNSNMIDPYPPEAASLLPFPDQLLATGPIVEPTFTCFKELPFEIRIKIWQCVCYHPRNVDIRIIELGKMAANGQRRQYFYGYRYLSRSSHPGALQACRESREEGLKHYQLHFGTSHQFAIMSITTRPTIYINFACDRIVLVKPEAFKPQDEPNSGARFVEFLEICAKNKLKSIALNIAWDSHWPYVDISTACYALEELVLFCLSSHYDEGEAGGDIDFIRTKDLAAYCIKSQTDDTDVGTAMRDLGKARRDFLDLFELHEAGLNSRMVSRGDSYSNTETTWHPPAVKIMHLTIGGIIFPKRWPYGN